ncbi:Hypothetical predicted protein [Cloeon dipterum]|uniref:Uncharacterized protein n=1 Tax=Cloeon dipterum TaxID=197152 RepID=A0A8S1DSF4_9INSE|nr:Hypothetical predicted protein [Cloeon dipterum]
MAARVEANTPRPAQQQHATNNEESSREIGTWWNELDYEWPTEASRTRAIDVTETSIFISTGPSRDSIREAETTARRTATAHREERSRARGTPG